MIRLLTGILLMLMVQISNAVESQLSATWLGGGAQEFMKGVADVFVNAGSIDSALDSYVGNVNTGPLEAANGM